MRLKRVAITLITLLAIAVNAKAQYMPQSSAFKIGFGKSQMTTSLTGGYTYFASEKVFISGHGNFEWGTLHQFDYTSLSANLLANYSLVNISGVVFLNIGAGPTIAYDTLAPLKTKGFDYGATGRIEVETFITDAVSFIISGNQAMMSKKDFGNYRSSIGVGFRFFM